MDTNQQFDLLRIIHEAIEDKTVEYSKTIQAELVEKYNKEFKERLEDYRRKAVLDVCEKLKIEYASNCGLNMTPFITIQI